MRKLFLLFILFLFSVTECLAYSIKLYDEYGNRIGTYRKNGDNYELYDFNDNKVESPEMLIKDAPTQKTLKEYSQTFYDENMRPIGIWRSGFYGNDGRYYPRYGSFYPIGGSFSRTPYIVRPRANNSFQYSNYRNGINYINNRSRINYVDARFPGFHKFR